MLKKEFCKNRNKLPEGFGKKWGEAVFGEKEDEFCGKMRNFRLLRGFVEC